MNNRSKLLMFYAAALAFSGEHGSSIDEYNREPKLKKPKPLPKGADMFYFYDSKIVSAEYAEIAEYKCVAINEKNAIKKYNKFKGQE